MQDERGQRTVGDILLQAMTDILAERRGVWDEAVGRSWEVIVVGGGITGAGVARESARQGLSVLLVEQKDFSWGTSSRSSKMIHGGLRYLKERRIQLTREAVRARQRLLETGAGLVEPLVFLYAVYDGDHPTSRTLGLGLTAYDLLSGSGPRHKGLDHHDISLLAPNLNLDGLDAAYRYTDARTDDARLVFRVLREAEAYGARTLNYARVEEVLRTAAGGVRGVAVTDTERGATAELRAKVVVNATGAWTESLGGSGEAPFRLRPLRGSHLVLPWKRLPAACAAAFAHPRDGRPVFVYPWEGVTLIGTTDVNHEEPPGAGLAASPEEVGYLLEAVNEPFEQEVHTRDLLGTFAGVRPVISGGRDRPSQESREHAVWADGALITVSGGKLTTFEATAREALDATLASLGKPLQKTGRGLEPPEPETLAAAGEALSQLPHLLRRCICGRLGPDLAAFLEREIPSEDLTRIRDTPYTWAELRWAAEKEAVVHLDDLLLRRSRLGHLLPGGGAELRDELERRLRGPLGWNRERWESEWERYERIWEDCYAPRPGLRTGSGVR